MCATWDVGNACDERKMCDASQECDTCDECDVCTKCDTFDASQAVMCVMHVLSLSLSHVMCVS